MFRIAGLPDAEALTGLINRAFAIEKFFVEGDRISLDAVRALFDTGAFLVDEDDAGLAGCVYLEPRGERCYLGLLSIDPDRQGFGLGSKLVAESEAWARGRGFGFMDLRIVNLREELPAFYRRLGYVETGTELLTPGLVTKLPAHFVNMSKGL